MKHLLLSTFLVLLFSGAVWGQCPTNCTNNNTFVGLNSGFSNTSGSSNSFVGRSTGLNNTIGSRNAFFGAFSGFGNTEGSDNSFFGVSAGSSNTAGSNNSFYGSFTGSQNLTGQNNSFFGRSAGQGNTTGSDNSFFGLNAGSANTEGSANAFFGVGAGTGNTIGVFNTFVGTRAGANNGVGNQNTFIGTEAGLNNAVSANTFIGFQSGMENTTGLNNTFVGYRSGKDNTIGTFNTFMGTNAGLSNGIGERNTFLGTNSGAQNTSGVNNTFLGASSGANTNVGKQNTFLGSQAGLANTVGSGNVFIGYQAGGTQDSTSNKLFIDNSNTVSPLIYGDFSRDIVSLDATLGIGTKNPERPIHLRGSEAVIRIDRDRNDPGLAIIRYDQNFSQVFKSYYFYTRGQGPNQGKFVIADWGQEVTGPSVPRFVIANEGNVGIGDFLAMEPSEKLTVAGNILSASNLVFSDKRFKEDIRLIPDAMNRLNQLKGVTYKYQTAKFENRDFPQGQSLGLIAQEVEKVFPELVVEDSEGYKAINYDGLIPVLIEALKEQQSRIEQLEAKLAPSTQEDIIPQAQQAPQLFQNNPNPFDQMTRIQMYLPEQVQKATLHIYNMQGQALRQIEINERGQAEVEVAGNTLQPGMYLYALIADGQEIDVKRMILQ